MVSDSVIEEAEDVFSVVVPCQYGEPVGVPNMSWILLNNLLNVPMRRSREGKAHSWPVKYMIWEDSQQSSIDLTASRSSFKTVTNN